MSGFRGGFGGGSGAAYQEMGFQDLNEAPLVYEKKKEPFRGGEAIGGRTAGPSNLGDLEEDFRGGGGEAIGGRTAGPSNLGDLGSSAELFSEQKETKRHKLRKPSKTSVALNLSRVSQKSVVFQDPRMRV